MTPHTETPWRQSRNGHEVIYDGRGEKIIICICADPANAAFIVRAVNNHNSLVSSLGDLIKALDEEGGFDKNPDPTSISGRARAALKAARGDV